MALYSQATKESEGFARWLGFLCRSTAYHSHLDKKDESLQGWIDGKYDVIVATSGLGLGVNVQNVSDVFHIGVPYKISDFVQQSGRAGRGGENVRSIIFVTQRRIEALRNKLKEGGIGHDEAAMIQMILAEGCRRRIISKFMDGEQTKLSAWILRGLRAVTIVKD
jgi:superfamily II DNA helicase RecQ